MSKQVYELTEEDHALLAAHEKELKERGFVSIEVAKVLKEKNYNEICTWAYYVEDPEISPLLAGTYQNKGEFYAPEFLPAPHLYDALQWLIEKKSIYVQISIYGKHEWVFSIWTFNDVFCTNLYNVCSKKTYDTYKEALNNGILAALNLIQNEN